MKKFLTVLLVIAVMFTFSFGSAFAAAPNYADAQTALAAQVNASNAAIDKAANDVLEKMTFVDGYLTASGDGKKLGDASDAAAGIIKKETIEKKVAELVKDAKEDVTNAVNLQYTAGYPLQDETDAYTTAEINEAVANVKVAGNAAVAGITIATVLTSSSETPTTHYSLADFLTSDLVDEYEKAALAELGAYDLTKYSAKEDEKATLLWGSQTGSVVTTGTDRNLLLAAGKLNMHSDGRVDRTENGTVYYEYFMTYRDLVKAIVDTQKAAVNGASGTNLAKIKTITGATKTAKDYILGHKKTATEGYYIDAIPTIEDLADTTTLDGQKAAAVKNVKANIALLSVNLVARLNDALDEENQNASPNAKVVSAIKEDIAGLDAQLEAMEKVLTARINYAKTKAAVDAAAVVPTLSFAGSVTTWKTDYKADKNDASTTNDIEEKLNAYQDILDNIEKLKAEAELVAAQKDVNGEQLVDPEVLKDALEDEIENLYNGGLLEDSIDAIQGSPQEAALVGAKYDYIEFINGTDHFGPNAPLDENKKVVENAWYTSDATRVTATENVQVIGTGGTAHTYDADTADVYDEAQAAELDKLVEETTAAIEAAKTVGEVKKIFAEANAKYEDIVTTAAHIDSWQAGGKLYAAYGKAEYAKELDKYFDYVTGIKTTGYPAYGTTNANAVKDAVSAIVIEAYTVDEIPAKVAEAKAYLDGLKTQKELDASKADVEKLIAAISVPATLADKDAIVAAADAYLAHKKLVGAAAPSNLAALQAAIAKYADLELDALEDAEDALDKTITTADKAAVEALRAKYDAFADFLGDYATTDILVSAILAPSEEPVTDAEYELLLAQVKEVREMMIKLPVNPTASQRAEVEAARAAYEALSLEGKTMVVGSLPWGNLIDAEEALEVLNVYAVKALKLTASSKATKGAITVKWTVEGDAEAADGYQIWKSTKMNKGYKKAFTTSKTSYKNTKGLKKGTKYYYKVRAYVVVDGKNVYSDWSNKAYRTAK